MMAVHTFAAMAIAAVCLGVSSRLEAEEDGPPPFVPAIPGFNYDLRDHGVAVKNGGFGWLSTATDPVDKYEKIYATFNMGNAGFTLVEMDARNGQSR